MTLQTLLLVFIGRNNTCKTRLRDMSLFAVAQVFKLCGKLIAWKETMTAFGFVA